MRYPAIAVCILFVASIAWPQASNTTVRGTVTDQAQAIIPSANVTLTNTATNVTRSTVTNEAGLYVFPGVTPGPYRISAEFAGMQKFEGNLTVQVQQDPVVDIVLQVGGTATTVEVQDVTPMVRMDSPSLGQSLERQRIEQLPVNGRGYQNLLVTVPGVQWSSPRHRRPYPGERNAYRHKHPAGGRRTAERSVGRMGRSTPAQSRRPRRTSR